MFTNIDKAFAAFIVAGMGAAASVGWDVSLDPQYVGAISGAIAGLVVWFIPNKEKEE